MRRIGSRDSIAADKVRGIRTEKAVSKHKTADWLPFTIGDQVSLKCGDGSDRGTVNGILLTMDGEKYLIGWSDTSRSYHWEHELIEPPEFI